MSRVFGKKIYEYNSFSWVGLFTSITLIPVILLYYSYAKFKSLAYYSVTTTSFDGIYTGDVIPLDLKCLEPSGCLVFYRNYHLQYLNEQDFHIASVKLGYNQRQVVPCGYTDLDVPLAAVFALNATKVTTESNETLMFLGNYYDSGISFDGYETYGYAKFQLFSENSKIEISGSRTSDLVYNYPVLVMTETTIKWFHYWSLQPVPETIISLSYDSYRVSDFKTWIPYYSPFYATDTYLTPVTGAFDNYTLSDYIHDSFNVTRFHSDNYYFDILIFVSELKKVDTINQNTYETVVVELFSSIGSILGGLVLVFGPFVQMFRSKTKPEVKESAALKLDLFLQVKKRQPGPKNARRGIFLSALVAIIMVITVAICYARAKDQYTNSTLTESFRSNFAGNLSVNIACNCDSGCIAFTRGIDNSVKTHIIPDLGSIDIQVFDSSDKPIVYLYDNVVSNITISGTTYLVFGAANVNVEQTNFNAVNHFQIFGADGIASIGPDHIYDDEVLNDLRFGMNNYVERYLADDINDWTKFLNAYYNHYTDYNVTSLYSIDDVFDAIDWMPHQMNYLNYTSVYILGDAFGVTGFDPIRDNVYFAPTRLFLSDYFTSYIVTAPSISNQIMFVMTLCSATYGVLIILGKMCMSEDDPPTDIKKRPLWFNLFIENLTEESHKYEKGRSNAQKLLVMVILGACAYTGVRDMGKKSTVTSFVDINPPTNNVSRNINFMAECLFPAGCVFFFRTSLDTYEYVKLVQFQSYGIQTFFSGGSIPSAYLYNLEISVPTGTNLNGATVTFGTPLVDVHDGTGADVNAAVTILDTYNNSFNSALRCYNRNCSVGAMTFLLSDYGLKYVGSPASYTGNVWMPDNISPAMNGNDTRIWLYEIFGSSPNPNDDCFEPNPTNCPNYVYSGVPVLFLPYKEVVSNVQVAKDPLTVMFDMITFANSAHDTVEMIIGQVFAFLL